jgi:glucose dehydrogenase
MIGPKNSHYDVVIVGSGIAGALVAKRLGLTGKRVLILEAGASVPPNFNDYMKRFYSAAAKVPEVPYTPEIFAAGGEFFDPAVVNAGRPTVLTLSRFQNTWMDPKKTYCIPDPKGAFPFASTYDRVAGGTSNHWLGTCLRNVPNDFQMRTVYQSKSGDWPPGLVDWPINYEGLNKWYGDAEHEIGVSADVKEQEYLGITFPPGYKYPMPGIPSSKVDQLLDRTFRAKNTEVRMEDDDHPLSVKQTPAARNSQPNGNRRACAGNTNCIPICPIQAKYDPTITLNEAGDTGHVDIWYRTVASEIVVGENGRIAAIKYIQYREDQGPPTDTGSVTAKVFVIAANAIETPRLLLMSKTRNGTVANGSKMVGKNLMDHPYYVAWALLPESGEQVWPYRGPLITSGIEVCRDGQFRSNRAAFRIDIGNEGWNFPAGDPYATTVDFINNLNINGPNNLGTGRKAEALFGDALVKRLNSVLTRQFRLGFLVEQTPDDSNCVTLAKERDGLGLPRPQIRYDLSAYTKRGFVAAKRTADKIFNTLNAKQYTYLIKDNPCTFDAPDGSGPMNFFGAGHIVGTCRMGHTKGDSVVDSELRSWEHPNLYIAGSSVFPTVATANPTLTIAALCLRLAERIRRDLA